MLMKSGLLRDKNILFLNKGQFHYINIGQTDDKHIYILWNFNKEIGNVLELKWSPPET